MLPEYHAQRAGEFHKIGDPEMEDDAAVDGFCPMGNHPQHKPSKNGTDGFQQRFLEMNEGINGYHGKDCGRGVYLCRAVENACKAEHHESPEEA